MSSSNAHPVIVGVDGVSGFTALDWAIDEAQRWNIPLEVRYARMMPLRGPTVESAFAVHTTESDEILSSAVAADLTILGRTDLTIDLWRIEPV